MKAIKTIVVIALSVCMVFTMMPLGSIQAMAIDEPQQSAEGESPDGSAVTETEPAGEQVKDEDAEASDEPGDGVNQDNTGTDGAETDDADVDKTDVEDVDGDSEYQNISVTLKDKAEGKKLPADKEHEVTVSAVNPNEEGDAVVRLYFWNYDKDFFDKDKKDKVKEICDSVTVKDLKDDDTITLDNETKDADKVKAELVTEKVKPNSDEMVRYLEFTIPSNSKYKFDVPLVLEEDVQKDASEYAELLHMIVEAVVDGQEDDESDINAIEVQWEAPETEETSTDAAVAEEASGKAEGINKLLKNVLKGMGTRSEGTVIASEKINDNLSWEIIETDGKYELKFTGTGTIPANFYKRAAFSQYATQVNKITISEGITAIGDNAFFCDYYKSIGMKSATEIEIQTGESGKSKLKTIGSGAFMGSRLKSIDLKNTSLETIGDSAFKEAYNLSHVTFPDSLKSIGRNAFEDTTVREVVIPAGVAEIPYRSFSSIDGLEKAVINGSTTIKNGAFYWSPQLNEVVFNDPEDGKTLVIEENAFSSCSSINTVTVNRSKTDLPSKNTPAFSKNTSYTFGDSVDTLDGDWFDRVVKVSNVTFNGPNDLTITKAGGSGSSYAPFKDLEGKYYVDSYGCLYKLNDDNTASLIYASPGEISSYTVPAEITTVGGETYNVTKIGEMAFAKADNLKSLIIEEPEQMSIGARVFSDSKITEVNNADKIDPKDYAYVSTACDFPLIEEYQEGKLVDQLRTSVPLEGTDAEGNPAMFHFSVDVTAGPLGKENGVYQYLTGQPATFTVAVDNMSNIDLQDRVVRIYFAFTGDEYAIGDYSIGKNYTVVNHDTGAEFPMSVVQTDQPGVFYYDIKGWRPGDTVAFRNAMQYLSPQSAGGDLYVWSESMEKEEAERLAGKTTDPKEYLKLHWGTKPVNFTTRKAIKYTPTSSSSNRPSYSADGTADSNIYVKDYIAWSITMNSGSDTNKNEGKDYVCYVDFTDTVKLPNDLIWDPKVIEAIQNGKYRFSTSNSFGSEYATIYVTIDGVDRQLISVQHESDSGVRIKNIKLTVEEDENGKSLVAVHWRKENTKWNSSDNSENNYPSAQLANQTVSFTVANNNLMVDRQSQLFKILKGEVPLTAETDKYIKQASVINNHVDTTRHYSFSGDKEGSADAPVMTISVPSGLTMSKGRPRPDDSYYFGGSSKFRISFTNTGIISNRQIGVVEDELHNAFYIKPDNIMTMFNDEQFGQYLKIEINPATLCSVVDETAVDVNGKETHLVSQNTGVNVPYNGCESTDSSVITSDAKMTLSWNENGKLVLKVDKHGNGSNVSEYTIGDGGNYSTLQKAFDAIGYVVTYRPRYKVTWDLPDDFVIYGGQTVQFDIPANAKQTTMMLERDNPGKYYSNSVYWNNTAYAYGHNGTTEIKKASINSSQVTPSLTFDKYATYNGKTVQDNIDIVNHTSVDYTLSFTNYKDEGNSWVEHYTGGTYDVLPLVDKIQGSQVLLVKQSDILGATWQETSDSVKVAVEGLNLPTYVENGTTYYVINKPGIYKNLKTNGIVADTVTVAQTSSGFETLIKWYFTNVTPQKAARTVKYKALVDVTLAGGVTTGDDGTTATKINVSNESWLGDHQTHRLYDSVSGGGRLIKFSKNIQNDDGSTVRHSMIADGDEATYKISLENTSDSEVVIDGSHMYDDLPSTAGVFAWSKDNVASVTYEADERGSECLTPGTEYWEVNSTQPVTGADTAAQGQYYIHWSNDFKIKFAPQGKVDIVVKLKFPGSSDVGEDGEPDNHWDAYIKKVAGGTIYNTFYFDRIPSTVTHELADQAEAVLKKGVYDTGWVNSYGAKDYTCSSHESRWYYQNGAGYSSGACITYYALLYNSGNVRLYLDDLQDTLPKGFHYGSMADQDVTSGKTGSWWTFEPGEHMNNRVLYSGNAYESDVNSIDTESDVDSNNGSGSRASYKLVTAKDGTNKITYVNANVTASKKSDAGGIEHLTFKVISPKGSGSAGPTIHQDPNSKKYYLNPGEALRFGYNCYVDTWRKTDDTALNAIAMPFYDKYGLGLRKNETTNLTARKKLGMADNNGDCEIISNAEAVSIYGHTGKTDNTQWLSSDVTVLRQKIAPGIKKTVGGVSPVASDLNITDTTVLGSKSSDGAKYGNAYSGTTSFSDIVNWKLDVYNESPYVGENSMSEFTVTDKVDAPYAFTGQVFYRITGPNNTSTTYNNAYTPLFTLGARSEGDTKVRIVEGQNVFNQYHQDTITINGPAKVYNNFSVQLLRDEQGSETLIIKFTKPKVNYAYPMVIPADGKMELCVHTQYNTDKTPLSSTLYNSAVLMTEQPYDGSLVSQGKPLYDEQTGENEGIQSGASVTITTGFASTASKTITEIGNEKNTANSEADKNYISLNDKTKAFRYDLIVNGPEHDPMSKLIVIDSLPEEGDHSPFVDRDKRDSEFKVSMLSDDLGLTARVIANAGKGSTTVLEDSQYSIEVNTKTEFDEDDWKGRGSGWKTIDISDGLSDEEKALIEKARSIRIIIHDDTVATMPANSRVKLSFNAKIDGEANPGEFAWNSFGYSYTVPVGLSKITLNAEPKKVGVHIPSIPRLIKDVVDKDDNSTNVARDYEFEAIIYTGAPIEALNDISERDTANIANILKSNKRNVLYVPLTVKKGTSSYDTGLLENGYVYNYDAESSEWVKTSTPWTWTNSQQYTVLELISPNERGYEVQSIAGNRKNNTGLTYNNTIKLRIGVVNKFTDRKTDLVIEKKCDSYFDGGADSNLSFGFKITGKNDVGETVYTNFAGLTFKKGEELTKTVTIEEVPINLDITVEEVYSGNYTVSGDNPRPASYDRKANKWTVSFENKHKEQPHTGSGVVNKYVDNQFQEQQGLPVEEPKN